jgi:predicted thioesterase
VGIHGGIVIAVPPTPSEPSPDRVPSAGRSASVTLAVTDTDTALSFGSGDVPVLATPRLVALCEEATCRVVDDQLSAGRTSVASRVQFDHLAPVGVGDTVSAEATLEKVEGRRLVFTVSVRLDVPAHGGLVGAGRITRVMVDRAKFLAKAGHTCD